MTKPQAFVVQPEWRGNDLCLGATIYGSVSQRSFGAWSGVFSGVRVAKIATAAVEAEVMKALGGKPI